MDVDKELERLLGANPGLTARQLASALGGVSKKDVNKALYRGQRAGRFHRSGDQRPLWSLAGREAGPEAHPSAASTKLADLLEPYVGCTAAELNANYDLGVNLSSKQQVREVAERLTEHVGVRLSSPSCATTRVIRIAPHRRAPAEDVQLGIVPFQELAVTPFERSRLREQLASVELVLFSREADLSASRFLGVHRWVPDASELALVAADYEAARSAIRRSDPAAVPRANAVHVVRYGTKGRLGTDVMSLPDGTPATKRAFYVVKRYLRSVLATPGDVQPSGSVADASLPEPSENAGLLLDLLRDRLG